MAFPFEFTAADPGAGSLDSVTRPGLLPGAGSRAGSEESGIFNHSPLHGPLDLKEARSPVDKNEERGLGEEPVPAELGQDRKAPGSRGELDNDPFPPRRVSGRAAGTGGGAKVTPIAALSATPIARARVLAGGMGEEVRRR